MSIMGRIEDIDPQETKEWLDAINSVLANDGPERVHFILDTLIQKAKALGYTSGLPTTTPYVNTIPVDKEAKLPGDMALEGRIRSLIRWNAMAMVVRAQKDDSELGGHIGTFASSASLYDVGFNHFWRAPFGNFLGDLIYIQGHASPGIYARSYLLGDLTEKQINNFRREVDKEGLSSYPHPWLMPDYWQFPTVSMGLGPLQAIYAARYMKYLEARGLIEKSDRKVWCFCGDGEMDEPESQGAIALAVREKLDNLIFVVNCNLQRLDGPVRGNGSIIQELEANFRGAGWNVIKLIWGGSWDPLLNADTDGLLKRRMEEVVDGEYQNYKAFGGEYTREHFFGKYPELKKRVEHLTDDDIWRLKRGGHDSQKIYAAYHSAVNHKGQPTLILAKTVKGYGLGNAAEARNTAHNTKKMSLEDLKAFRDRFNIPIKDEDLESVPLYKPSDDSPEIQYLKARRAALGGRLPQRSSDKAKPLPCPGLEAFSASLESTGDREISTTMAFVRILSMLTKDKGIGQHVVPIVPDEARTFGMEGLFRQLGIYATEGQKYQPVDSKQVMFYKESKTGQILEEGINEAGAFCSWISAATSYSVHQCKTIPFYIYYSMFGFQRIGDLAWLAGDMRARGFLIGGTSGRTTLNGEGLQHQDGHSHILASTVPNCVSYDPTFSYELAVIIQHGLKRMIVDDEDVYFYITTMNENYMHPQMPSGVEEGIIRGLYPLMGAQPEDKSKKVNSKNCVNLLGAGSILLEVIKAKALLEKEFGLNVNIYSMTSLNELRRDALKVQRVNHLNPKETKKTCYFEECVNKMQGPIVMATDYMRLLSDQMQPFTTKKLYTLGTDGFGRSDTRAKLRHFFEVDSYHIAYTAVKALCDEGHLSLNEVDRAIKLFGINPNKPDPTTV